MFAPLKLFAAAVAILFSTTTFADLAIIVNPGYHDGKLGNHDIKRIFLGERSAFPDGINANPINHSAGSPDRKAFFSSVLGMSESSYERYWRRKFSTGNFNQPVELSSHIAILKAVASTPGSISYIDSRVVNDKVKVLMVLDKNGITIN